MRPPCADSRGGDPTGSEALYPVRQVRNSQPRTPQGLTQGGRTEQRAPGPRLLGSIPLPSLSGGPPALGNPPHPHPTSIQARPLLSTQKGLTHPERQWCTWQSCRGCWRGRGRRPPPARPSARAAPLARWPACAAPPTCAPSPRPRSYNGSSPHTHPPPIHPSPRRWAPCGQPRHPLLQEPQSCNLIHLGCR